MTTKQIKAAIARVNREWDNTPYEDERRLAQLEQELWNLRGELCGGDIPDTYYDEDATEQFFEYRRGEPDWDM